MRLSILNVKEIYNSLMLMQSNLAMLNKGIFVQNLNK